MKKLIKFLRKVKFKLVKESFRLKRKPFTKTTILFQSFAGRQISDSPLAIYNAIKEQHPEYDLYWVINKRRRAIAEEMEVPYICKNTFKWAKYMLKSHIWIENARQPKWVIKPQHVKIIQTWHGTPLKKLGLDIENVTMPGTNTEAYRENFVNEANKWDVLLSPNHYSSKIFRSAFGYENEIMEIGYPRNDNLIQQNTAKLKLQMGIPLDKKVILYAPTYRDNQYFKKGKYAFKLPFSLKQFKKRFGDNAVLVLRMHYLISNSLDLTGFEDFAYNLSSYPDISDIYQISDVLVTDYSSVFFDFAYLRKPIIFFPYDYEVYEDDLRGFYLDYDKDLPGDIVFTPMDLRDKIDSVLNQNINMNKFSKFYDKFCYIEPGNASNQVVKLVENMLNH